MPPGTMRTSMSPLGSLEVPTARCSAKVVVGTMLCPKLPFTCVALLAVETGSSVLEKIERYMVVELPYSMERVLRTSRGPKTSRAWNCGKTRRP